MPEITALYKPTNESDTMSSILPQNPLYITEYPTLSLEELKQKIVVDVEATQSKSLVLPLPDAIIMRTDQYDLLQDDKDLFNAYDSKEYIYTTPLNAMEVRIQGFND